MAQQTVINYRLILTAPLTTILSRFEDAILPAYMTRQEESLQAFCTQISSVNIEEIDVEVLIYNTCEHLYGTIVQKCQNHHSDSVVREFIKVLSQHLMLNAYCHMGTLVLILDLLSPTIFKQENMKQLWLNTKYKNELYLNTLH